MEPDENVNAPMSSGPRLVRPGQRLNPTGIQGTSELRRARMEFTKALLQKGNEPCDIAGFEGMTFFEAGMKTLFHLYVAGEEWAVKEIHNRAYGRVPIDVGLMVQPPPPLDTLSTDAIVERIAGLMADAQQLRDGTTIEAEAIRTPDGSIPPVIDTPQPGKAPEGSSE